MKRLQIIITLLMLFVSSTVVARTYPIPENGNVVGAIEVVTVKAGENFPQIARDNDIGYVELREANPGVDPDNPAPGSVLVIPSQYVLPDAPYRGIVVNLAEMRLYYYPSGTGEVTTYPIGIGRAGEDTPLGVMSIIEKRKNPTWNVPESIRKSRAEEGVILPRAVPPGPDNPLGDYSLRLSNPSYLIHGTNEPLGGIGRRSSAGCLRLYPEDIEPLYQAVNNGTPVNIINEPYKAGVLHGRLYIESHVPLEESGERAPGDDTQIKQVINTALQGKMGEVNWPKALQITDELQGIPQEVGEIGGGLNLPSITRVL